MGTGEDDRNCAAAMSDKEEVFTDDLVVESMKTVLVPVRDPVTKQIKETLVPIEMTDQSGMNIIKSVLIPINGEDGLVSYEIKKVIVPIQSAWSSSKKPPADECKPKLNESAEKRVNGRNAKLKKKKKKKKMKEEVEVEEESMVMVGKEQKEETTLQQKTETGMEVEMEPKQEVEDSSPEDYRDDVCNDTSTTLSASSLEEQIAANEALYAQSREETSPVAEPGAKQWQKGSNEQRPYFCDVCSLYFYWTTDYRRHMIKHDTSKCERGPFDESSTTLSASSMEEQKNPPSNESRCTSTQSHQRPSMLVDPLSISAIPHERDDADRMQYFCSICSLHFCRSKPYKRHMVKHSDLRPYACETCGKTFKRSSERASHRHIHRGNKHACELCGFATSKKASLKMHHKRIHERDYPYRCDQCDKRFMSNCELLDHKDRHLGKTFACDICGNVYPQESYLKSHRRGVHGINQRAPKFQCGVCKKGFVRESKFREHVSLHSQVYLCAHCGKEFASNLALSNHNRVVHAPEKRFKCTVCVKAFTSSSTLAVHKLTHTGERPYLCDVCGQCFTQRSSMMVHRKKHPGNHPRPPPVLLSKRKTNKREF